MSVPDLQYPLKNKPTPPPSGEWFNPRLFPEVTEKTPAKNIPRFIKKGLDIAGSFSCLVILSPAFLIIALGIKLTSKGPVLFQEDRLGQWGKTFAPLQLRSMNVSNDHSVPKEYLTKFITGGTDLPLRMAGEGGGRARDGP